ncbi:MAG: hypothetical protein HW387_1421 [Parachlamydiales bacterium]|nr:hypothetical protein [Parachlamydiales bacterium]
MQKAALFVLLWVLFNGCTNNDPVNRPYIISQSQTPELSVDADESHLEAE